MVLIRFFKFLFKGKVNDLEKSLQNDPILKQKTKELHENVDELTKYIEDNWSDHYS